MGIMKREGSSGNGGGTGDEKPGCIQPMVAGFAILIGIIAAFLIF